MTWAPRPAQPYKPGNWAALKYGAHSERQWRPLADALEAWVVLAAPWTAGEAFAPTRARWARAEAQAQLAADWLDQHGPLDAEGEAWPAHQVQARAEATAHKCVAELGLSPLGMARLLGSLSAIDAGTAADGLEQLKAAGQAIREGAEARAIGAASE